MSNVIEFKKKPEPAAPVEPVEIGPEHYTPEHYRLVDLVRYEYSDRSWADRDGYAYQHTLEQHAQLVAYFAAAGSTGHRNTFWSNVAPGGKVSEQE
ncbi:hypothetical protein, partial [Burkholderia ubonensis]|uniref:hypothetical protein n=1 Tax=Burkholderia ubonensis TaxID=101571 RepID=UPI000AD38C6F